MTTRKRRYLNTEIIRNMTRDEIIEELASLDVVVEVIDDIEADGYQTDDQLRDELWATLSL